jgi:hypothetical protein
MRNFTSKVLNVVKDLFFVAFFLFNIHIVFSQFYSSHYVVAVPWSYFSIAKEIVIDTNSISTENIALKKKTNTFIAFLPSTKNTPTVYWFSGLPSALVVDPFNTIVDLATL